ncbi:MAG: transglutaminase domain-containing protein [Lachnospiraceae bacterium]|nr:transglutaminase domain-containing protein [Lachnospiraceae bacterium]
MHIFGRKKKTESPELTLMQAQESQKYDFFSVLAKALLLFLLVYGALGGFLSALEIEYNNGLCMLVLIVLALILSAVYETGKRWLTNLVSFLLFVVYLYIAVSYYWVINSGYYEILNRIYELARQYLNVQNGTEYSLMVEESYLTVTVFALFFGMVGVILLNMMLQNKSSLLKVILLTLTPYVVLFYLECSPELIYVIFLFAGYLTAAILQGGNVREKMARQMRYILPLAMVISVLLVRLTAFLLPEIQYGRIVPKNTVKASSEKYMARFAQFDMWAIFSQGSSGTGVSGGMLSKGSAVIPTYETALIVRYTPYDIQPVYLKAFTGKDYLGNRWSKAEDELLETGFWQGRGIMEVEKPDDTDGYDYQPYYTDEELTVKQGNVTYYTYYPAVGRPDEVTGQVDEAYLDVPESCRNAVERVCEAAGFAGTEEEIALEIISYFQKNYSYTLRPGFYIGHPDYITHFLLESKRGYCAHFASAATMLFRQMGIPARYVEGYAFSYFNVVEEGALVEGAEYSDYYEGYAPLGETALIEMEIPDAYAHAWVEIYVDGMGWIVVDPTPARTEQEDILSFWDAFMNRNGEGTNLNMGESNLGAYLETVLSGMSYVLLCGAGLFVIVLWTLYLWRAHKEKKLSGRERVQLEYGRIESYLSRKYVDYRKLRTLREQLQWMRDHGGLEISREQEDALYEVYFAENVSCNCEELCRQLRKMRNLLRYKRIR